MVRPEGPIAPLLARPYALYQTVDGADGSPEAIDIVYLVMGEGTKTLASTRSGRVELWGPLGGPFPDDLGDGRDQRLLIVAGGIGQTPFPAVIDERIGRRRYGAGRRPVRPNRIEVVWGVRSNDLLGGLDDFHADELFVATNDGSAGHRGFVTDVIAARMASEHRPTAVFACGPEPMLGAVSSLCQREGVPLWVSLETKMACGYGVCFSCVCPVHEEADWDYRRVCLDGPVFPADRIAWDVLLKGH
jgi:dihydroorotate dehydrogenase electron transfer subunit